MTQYTFRDDRPLTIKSSDKADPQKIGEALETIAAKAGGKLTPPAIVDAARNRQHVLHKHFEWDDAVAAQSFRLDQARSIVSAIHIISDETESGYTRGFLSIHERDGTAYRTHAEVISSADLQSKVLAMAERDLLAFEARYRSLTDICNLIRKAREQVQARRSKVGQDTRMQA